MNQWIYRDGADETSAPSPVRDDPVGGRTEPRVKQQRYEFLALSLALSVGVVAWNYLVHLWTGMADHRGLAALDHGLRDVLISLPLAFVAVGVGQWLATRLEVTGAGRLYALSRAMVISLTFTVLSIPLVGLHRLTDGFLGDSASHTGGGLEHDTSPVGLVVHGLRDAMIGEAAALPLAFGVITLLSTGIAARLGNLSSASFRGPIPVLAAATMCLALVGGFMGLRIVTAETTYSVEARVPTSFGALWLSSFEETAVPKSIHRGMVAMPSGGSPDQVTLEVVVTVTNTTRAPVELTPARFALRLEPGADPISVKGAGFESIRLLPGAMFDARIQFPIEEGGDYQPKLLFDDLGSSGSVAVDLGQMRFQDDAGGSHDDHY